jgi:hypothetical protein
VSNLTPEKKESSHLQKIQQRLCQNLRKLREGIRGKTKRNIVHKELCGEKEGEKCLQKYQSREEEEFGKIVFKGNRIKTLLASLVPTQLAGNKKKDRSIPPPDRPSTAPKLMVISAPLRPPENEPRYERPLADPFWLWLERWEGKTNDVSSGD